MSTQFTPAQTGLFRVFLIEDRAGPSNEPDYQSSMMLGGIDHPFGDEEAIKVPHPGRYDEFVEIGSVKGAADRPSTSLTGQYALDLASEIFRLGRKGCAIDVQVHGGECTDPRIFNEFVKAIILEDVKIGNWSTDDLGSLSDDDRAQITESGDITASEVYEVLQLTLQERAPDVVQNVMTDVVICDTPSCGQCDNPSDGCERIYALQGLLAGSPGTAPDVIYSIDGGLTFASDEVNTLTSGEAADAIACIVGYVTVVSNASQSLHYKDQDDIDDGTAGGWVEVTTGFVAAGAPNDLWSLGHAAFVVGDGGYVYYCTDPSNGVTSLDAGVATSENLKAVHALDDKHALAVGENDTLIYTSNRYTWNTATATGNGGTLAACWMATEEIWWVLASDGTLYYTENTGQTWTEKSLPGNIDTGYDIAFGTDSVGYVCGAYNSNPRAWRSYNGGYSWKALPEGVQSLPSGTSYQALAACEYDANFVVFVGEGAADDGTIVVGED